MSDLSTDIREHLQAALGSAYAIERELGGGGMSRVFVAEETALGRKVVVKVLTPELARELSAERFEREVRLAAQLQHPQIVPVLTAGDADGMPYYTMPLVEGESLRAQLGRGDVLPIAHVIGVLRDVAKALEFAHARGVVHRDIKPDNVLLAGSSAAVTDFGIAKALSASKATGAQHGTLTQLGTSIGTPAYMAPEQAAGDPNTDHRADIYAFGCMAYELLTGATPFGDKPPHQLIMAHFSERPAPVSERRPETPPALAHLVMRCLEKAPESRPQSASEVLADLDACLTGSGTVAALPTNRGSTYWMVAAVGTLVLVAGVAAWMRRSSRPIDEQIIAVLPFRVAGAEPSLHYLREGMLDLVSARLASGTGARSVDSRTVLAAWHKAGGDDRNDVPEDASRSVASRIGAGQVLIGDIVGNEKQITVHAALVGAIDGKRSDASVSGPADSLQILVDRLTAELLTRRAGEAGRLASLTSTSLPALRAYLDGQANYRRGRWDAAGQSFNAALDADTSFGLAALGVIQASRWSSSTRDVPRANRIAWRLRDRLSPRDRALLVVLLGANYPRAQSIGERGAASEHYRDLAPDSPDAWYQVGDWNFHFGIGSGIVDAPRRSIDAFSKALELDSTFTPALEHLPDLYAAVGDSAKLRRAIGLLVKTDSGNTLAGARMIAAAELGDSAEVRAVRSEIPHMRPNALIEIVYWARAGRVGLDDGARAVAALRSSATTAFDRNQADLVDMLFESDAGHPAKAGDALTRIGSTPGDTALRVLGALFWDLDTTGVSGIVRGLEEDAHSAAVSTSVNGTRVLFDFAVAGEYYASTADTKALARTIDGLRAIKFGADTAGIARVRDNYQLLLETQLAVLTHRPDLKSVLAHLDSVLVRDPEGELLSVGDLAAARGWEAAGDPQRALAAIRRTTNLSAPLEFHSTLLREEGRLAALTGDREFATRCFQQYLALRSGADPVLKPQVDGVRADLQRLEAQRPR